MLGRKAVAISSRVLAVATQEHTDETTDRPSSGSLAVRQRGLWGELDRCRELTNQIPTNGDCNATHFDIQIAVNALWTLRENIRSLLHLHREGQRAMRKRHEKSLAQALSKPASGNAQILHLYPSAPTNSNALKHVNSRAASGREAIAKRRRPLFSNSNTANKVA